VCFIIKRATLPERFSNSDARANLGYAIATVQLLEKVVFIAMGGIFKEHTEIKTVLERGKKY